MLDIGWTELVVIAIVLIVVVGPKDLPPMLRAFGRMTTKLRGMASDFRQQFDEALREAELDDVKKTIDDARRLNPANAIREAINPLRQAGQDIRNDLQNAARPTTPAAAPTATPAAAPEALTTDSVAAGLGLPEVPVGETLHSDPMPLSSGAISTSAPAEAAKPAAPSIKGEPAKVETVAAAARASAEKQLKRLDEAEAAAIASGTADADKPVKAGRKSVKLAKEAEPKAEKPRSRKKAVAEPAAETVSLAEPPVKKPRAPRKTKTTTGDEA
ncbi:Sec-independent protein translocase protein TatB [Rhizobium sp. SG2393]|uniref:Sec-independent protein translocase protein TatB n=1 Tax=Rhizobium sp. SG2393 TaxID=3276279 RepID=UPI00366F8F40